MKIYEKIKKEHLFIFIVLLIALIIFNYFNFGYTGLTVKDTCFNQGHSCCSPGSGKGNYYFSLDNTCNVNEQCYDSCEVSENLITTRVSLVDAIKEFFDKIKSFFTKQPVGGGVCKTSEQQCYPDSNRYYQICGDTGWNAPRDCGLGNICKQLYEELPDGTYGYIDCIPGALVCTVGTLQPATQCLVCSSQGNSYVQDNTQCSSGLICNTAGQCVSQVTTFTLGVNKQGTGDGTVTSSPTGITCGTTCSASYTSGTQVTLTASADSTSTFDLWQGCDIVSGNICIINMNNNKVVAPTFTKISLGLTVNILGTGSGTVTSNPTGLSCSGKTCVATFATGTSVNLLASPDTGSKFDSWSGCNSASDNICTVIIDTASKTVSVTFSPISGNRLSVTKLGTGSGTITSTPTGIYCGATCSASYTSGTPVWLTADADLGSKFDSSTGWTGCDTIFGNTCKVTMNSARSVSATFTPTQVTKYTLTINKAGTGSGYISSDINDGIDCSSFPCIVSYNAGTQVFLDIVQPNADSTFAGWTGCDRVSGNTCIVNMNSNRQITATFISQVTRYTLTINKAGTGSGYISSDINDGIDCSSFPCIVSYNAGTQVFLDIVQPNADSTFAGWTGCDSVSGFYCILTLNSNRQVTVTFNKITQCTAPSCNPSNNLQYCLNNVWTNCPSGQTCDSSTGQCKTITSCTNTGQCNAANQEICINGQCISHRLLTVNKQGTGKDYATITDGLGTINCGSDCSQSYPIDTQVTLQLNYNSALTSFDGWGGQNECSGSAGSICVITMNAAKTVTATFTAKTQTCTPGSLKTGATCLVCKSDGTGYNPDNTKCPSGQTCNIQGQCQAPVCTAPLCNPSNSSQYCVSGQWASCGNNQTCSAGQCTNVVKEICNNNIDDDGDGIIDAIDRDCALGASVSVNSAEVSDDSPFEFSEINLDCTYSVTGETSLAKAQPCITASIAGDDCKYKSRDKSKITFTCNTGPKEDGVEVGCYVSPNCNANVSTKKTVSIDVTRPDLCAEIAGESRAQITSISLNKNTFNIGDDIRSKVKVKNLDQEDLSIVSEAYLYDVKKKEQVGKAQVEELIKEGNSATLEPTINTPSVEKSLFRMYYKVYEKDNEDELCLEGNRSLDIKGTSGCLDRDNDGFKDAVCGGDDCNDNDVLINPDAAEICSDNKDNNCNELIDAQDPSCQAAQCKAGDTRECGSAAGECKKGTQTCANGTWSSCQGAVLPSEEICNDGKDNNCNGKIDAEDDACADKDTDNDGLQDGWEIRYFHNLNQNAEDDFDGDGFSNLQEFQANTDPTDPEDHPAKPNTLLIILIVLGVIVVAFVIVWLVALKPKKPKTTTEQYYKPPTQFKPSSGKPVNPALRQYIQNSLKKGFTRQQIKNALLSKGWDKREIEEAFRVK